MTIPSTDSMASASAERAAQAERSPLTVFLRIARVVVWILWAVVLVTAFLLLLAFVLRLAGANPDTGFVEWVERSVDRAMSPFRGIFPEHELSGDSVLDMSLLFAAIVYFVLALIIDGFLRWLTHRLYRQQQDVARLQADADQLARQATAEHRSAELAAHDAAVRAYERQQVAADQYAVAQAAAQEALAHHSAQLAAQSVRAKPGGPSGGAGQAARSDEDVPPTAPDAG